MRNNCKFFIIQIVELKGTYFLFTRWGRLNERGQNACRPLSLKDAVEAFEKKFHEKTKNKWGTPFTPDSSCYTLVTNETGSNPPQQVPNPLKSEADPRALQRIVEEEERKKKLEQEKKDEELARQLMREERGDYEDEGEDDDEMGAPSKIPCKYGSACYRKNPDHLRQYSHPPKSQSTSTPAYQSYSHQSGDLTDEDEDRSIDDSHEEASEDEEFYPGSQDTSFEVEPQSNARNTFSSDFVSGYVPGVSNLFAHQAKAALQSVQAIFPFAPPDIIATVLGAVTA